MKGQWSDKNNMQPYILHMQWSILRAYLLIISNYLNYGVRTIEPLLE